ncbi:MAG TPA: sulfite exporter TauE/SafE family protein [Bacilli bacterium]
METFDIVLLTLFIFIGAALYSTVGHGGASAYLAVMALLGLPPILMKPIGLVLNILVSSIATIRFYKAKCFSWSIFLPISLAAIPFAYIGGSIAIPSHWYKIIAGIILLFSAIRLFYYKPAQDKPLNRMPLSIAVIAGILIGFLSGLVGVGGGIFLSPLLLFMGWSNPRTTSGISAAFIFVNSVSGLLGHSPNLLDLPAYLPLLAVAAITGGIIGSRFGSKQQVQHTTILRLLAVVLIIAGLKLILV